MSEAVEPKTIQEKITEHEAVCARIDEQINNIVKKMKEMQEVFRKAQGSLSQLNGMKIARTAAIGELKSLIEEPAEEPKTEEV